MRSNRFLPKILLIVGFLALFLVFKYQKSIQEFLSFNLEKAGIYFENFFSQTGSTSKRRRPLSLLERETELKLYIGEPFIDFTPREWNEFWNLIYGVFPKESSGREGLPKKMRQLTQDEVAFELMSMYPSPFAYFKESHWNTLFSVIFKK